MKKKKEKAEQLSHLGEGLTKKKLLKSPKAKVRVVSSSKLMKQFAGSGYRMFKSEGNNYSQQGNSGNRSSIFQNEFDRERRVL